VTRDGRRTERASPRRSRILVVLRDPVGEHAVGRENARTRTGASSCSVSICIPAHSYNVDKMLAAMKVIGWPITAAISDRISAICAAIGDFPAIAASTAAILRRQRCPFRNRSGFHRQTRAIRPRWTMSPNRVTAHGKWATNMGAPDRSSARHGRRDDTGRKHGRNLRR